MKRILFTGVGRRIELIQAFRNAALALGKDLQIYGADLAGTAPALAYCDHTRQVVAMRDPDYIDNLLGICAEDGIDLLVPTIDTDLLALSENRERFARIGTRVMISAPETIRICRDKGLTSRFFADCGLRAPMPERDWRTYGGGFPAFIKPRDGSSSVNAFRAKDAAELALFADRIGEGGYVVQPFIDGREYTVDIFCDWDGNPISIVPRERLQVRAGEVLKTRIALDPDMIRESRILCAACRPCGALAVQLIRDSRSGLDYFIEINPRFGGGAPLSMKAGARSAEAILKLLDGEPVEYMADIADGSIYSRFDQSVCIAEGHNEIRGVVFDLDDTLYGEKEYVRSGYRAVSAHLGENCEERLWAHFQAGRPAIDALLAEIGREEEREEVLGVYRRHRPDIRLYDGIAELLQRLRAEGKKIGIITDGRPEGQRNKIAALGLAALVDDIIITDELGGPQFRKPCDIAFRIMQHRWRLPAGQMVYVGDNPVKDFQAPRQLGMKTLWFRNREGIYTASPDMDMETCGNLSEMSAFLADRPCL